MLISFEGDLVVLEELVRRALLKTRKGSLNIGGSAMLSQIAVFISGTASQASHSYSGKALYGCTVAMDLPLHVLVQSSSSLSCCQYSRLY